MGRKRKGTPREKQRKKVNVKFVEREHAGKTVGAYLTLDALVQKHHSQLSEARIAIAWRYGLRPDSDGRRAIVQVRKGSDLDRELHGFDFVFLVNHDVWNVSNLDQQRAILDHACCHCQISRDSNGEPKTDDNGRTVYRLRKHDIEEFSEVVARNGLWLAEIKAFAMLAIEKIDQPLLASLDRPQKKKMSLPKTPPGAPSPAPLGLHEPEAVAAG